MLGCCHCLCSQEYNAYTRVAACYPADGRADPVAARVRELTNWGIHDVSRFSKIHEIISERIRQDIQDKNFNSASVGVKIISRLLENVRDLNHPLSTALTNAILLLVRTKDPQYLALASEASESLLRFTLHHQLSQPIQKIFKAYMPLCNEKEEISEIAFNSISKLVEQSSIEWIPLEELFGMIKDKINTNNAAKNVLVSVAHASAALTLPKVRDICIKFFNEQNLWNDSAFLVFFMSILFSEMKENCVPPFFRLWLQLLPPRADQDNAHCREIISVAVHLTEELPNSHTLLADPIDPLLMVYLFILKLPNLDYEDKDIITQNSLTLCHTIASRITTSEMIQIANRQIWNALPIEEESTNYDINTVKFVFKVGCIVNHATANSLTKAIVNDCLRRVLKFLLKFSDHKEKVYVWVLDYLKDLAHDFPVGKNECIVTFLLALQKEVKKTQPEHSLVLHTFILCAMKDVSEEGSKEMREYVDKVAKKRLKASPPMIDTDLKFLKKYYSKIKKVRFAGSKPSSMYNFKKKKIISINVDMKDRKQSMNRIMSDMVATKSPIVEVEEEEEILEDNMLFNDLSSLMPIQNNNGNDDEDSEFSELPEQLDKALEHAKTKYSKKQTDLEAISNLNFENRSSLSQL